MGPKSLARIDEVTSAFAKWKAAQERAAIVEKKFHEAVDAYGKGRGLFPDQLYDELKELRHHADELLLVASSTLQASSVKQSAHSERRASSSTFGPLTD